MSYFHFQQNNSGGYYDGPKHIWVEARDAEHANERALFLDTGVYFNGCESDRDCSCCGDRWSEAYGEGTEVPHYYDTPVVDGVLHIGYTPYPKDSVGLVYRLDGTKEEVKVTK